MHIEAGDDLEDDGSEGEPDGQADDKGWEDKGGEERRGGDWK